MQTDRSSPPNHLKGRAAISNPGNRFEGSELFLDEATLASRESVKTEFLLDKSSTIITENQSPDIPFRYSINPYRGCEHGCIYCYARPTHEYLGYSAGLDFESKIVVRERASELLEAAITRKKWTPEPIVMSGVTDPYQPIERKLEITRKCLSVFSHFRHPVAMITKNAMVARDIDFLSSLAKWDCVAVSISITSLDAQLARSMEPRTASPRERIDTVARLSAAGIPVGVMVAPVIPGLTDVELPSIIEAATRAGARWIRYVPIRLPYGVKDLFVEWLESHYPSKKERVLSRIQSLRGGKLNESNFHQRFKGEGAVAEELTHLFRLGKQRAGFEETPFKLDISHFRKSSATQLSLF